MPAATAATTRPSARLIALTRDVPRHPAAIAFARRELERLSHELTREQLGHAQLVVTELVTNALLHGRGQIRLDVEVRREIVRGQVLDAGGGFSYHGREAGPEAVSGRGLQIVDALSAAWGIAPDRSLVWFELAGGA
jgi:anti-sigma regulatory factor (Ser/Thr protein kinase)